MPTRRASPPIATTISAWRSPTRSPACAPASARSNAPSTASASAPATPSLEEVVMAMKVRNDVLPYWTNVDTTMLMRASKLVSAVTSFPVQYNKAIVGRNAFAHESGIHQDGMLKHTQTYEIMTPRDRGREADLAGDGQAFRPSRLRAQARGARLPARRQPARGRLRALQGARRPQEARLRRGSSRRWSTRRSRTPRTASSWCRSRSSPGPTGRSVPP